MLPDELATPIGLPSSGFMLVGARTTYRHALFNSSKTVQLDLTHPPDTPPPATGSVRDVRAHIARTHAALNTPRVGDALELRLLRQPPPHVQHDPDCLFAHGHDLDSPQAPEVRHARHMARSPAGRSHRWVCEHLLPAPLKYSRAHQISRQLLTLLVELGERCALASVPRSTMTGGA